MKWRNLFIGKVAAALLLIGLTGLAWTPSASAATPEEIEEAIVKGLAWLAGQQNVDGSWGSGCDRVARTGLAVLKFETRAIELGMDPMGEEFVYSPQVKNGLEYIASNAHDVPISVQPAGNPDTNGNGKGTYFNQSGCGGHDIYNTGIAMMALAASGHPELYASMLQDAVDYMAWAQADVNCGPHRGGWRYQPDCNSDNSNSGYVTLGLGFAQAPPPYGFGLTVPQFVKDELSIWIDTMQDDVNGDTDDGGSWYDPFNRWVNILKTGNLLYEMALVGDTVETQRVKDAIAYIVRHWNDPNPDPGWKFHRQAMFAMMKGFEALGISKIDLDGDGIPEHDWFDEVSTHLVTTQNADGSWPYDYWGDPILSTAWALLTLERSVPQVQIPVFVDIKPGSCPNPLNLTSKGVLPVAVLGTDEFDVSQIDPATIKLTREGYEDVGVSPLRWSFEDVATPFEGELCDCHTLTEDGYVDLSLKFNTQELVSTLGLSEVSGQTIPLILIGNLKEENGGTPIRGQDCIRVQK